MAIFNMFDLTEEKFEKLYKDNQHFFNEIGDGFYLKNDLRRPEDPSRVFYGSQFGDIIETDPTYSAGAVALFSKIPVSDALRNACEESQDYLVRFKLKDGSTDAYISTIIQKGKERVGLVIKNDSKTSEDIPEFFESYLGFAINKPIRKFPFSHEGKTSYAEAVNEFDTLPNMVESDAIIDLLPDGVLDLISASRVEEKTFKGNQK